MFIKPKRLQIIYSYIPWKHPKTIGFLDVSRGIENGHWPERG